MKKLDKKRNTKKYKTREEIASEYCISRRTLYRWIKRKKLKISSGLLSLEEQNKIYDIFGDPR